ncbi:hypothetical protein GYMLUDRAFT_179637 [Collybiopsis luxurians FD-317 M1]|uniref:BTB domain-containing protein n=1 Tax=Collybiopsis luxurians FD-317 M1 TaxID=944289 RepID=A0A0D0CD32_9AGAR|nr:hypothetical protein GYMLUDRAFT_179637 [Collybiopsis luxurians FD-317 M1]
MITQEADSDSLPIVKNPNFWFSDGNIVLLASMFAFKIHRGQLQRHSEFFDGMFDIPQPSKQDTLEGCPLVEMQDSPDDLYHFLGALYDGLYLSFPRPAHFARLASVLRLSTKYLVPHLRQQCLERLTLDWPCTLEAWDARENEALGPNTCYSPRQYTPHPTLVIDLAIELSLDQFLPSAFYDLSRYGPSKIMYGTPGIKSILVSPDEEPRYVCLSNQLFIRTLRGRECAQRFLLDFLSTHVENRQPSVKCLYRHPLHPSLTKSHPCVQGFQQIYFDTFRCIGGVAIGRDADPLFTLNQAMERLTKPHRIESERMRALMCSPCKLEFLDVCARGREAAWGCIPSWFGLEEVIEGWGGLDSGSSSNDEQSD